MSHPVKTPCPRQLSIGLVAYGVDGPDPSLVMVRVPTERGRYVLTDRCVVEVPCRFCHALVGEPCRRGRKADRHGVGTHWVRREDWQRRPQVERRARQPKLRVHADDLAAAAMDPEAGHV